MDEFTQITAVCIVGAVLSAFLRKSRPEFAFCIGALTIGVSLYMAVCFISPVVSFLKELQRTADISDTVVTPVLKTVAIGLLTELSGCICTDAGENALAKVTQICGLAAVLFCALPLAQGVLQLVRSMLGG